MQTDDTIVAISSAIGRAPRAIVRLSGPRAIEVVDNLCDGAIVAAPSASATNVSLRLHSLDIHATVYLFRAPRSATGDDVVELHLPGNALIVRWAVDAALTAGARTAEAGEFTARGYFNRRLDLPQAEGIAAAIGASNQAELDAARRLIAGVLAERLKPLAAQLAETLALVEVSIDFSEEEVTLLSRAALAERLNGINASLRELVAGSARIDRIHHEPTIVLVGWPNAGKSTLLNALAGMQRAVVSPVAGTTRDLIAVPISLRRGYVRLIDSAGFDSRIAGDDSPIASIERQMQHNVARAIETADVVLLVHEASDRRESPSTTRSPHLIVHSKADLVVDSSRTDGLPVSAKSGQGMNELKTRLDELAFGTPSGSTREVSLNARHFSAISEAIAAIDSALMSLDDGMDVLAWQLRGALDSLGSVSGAVSTDEVLGLVFSTFCIGK